MASGIASEKRLMGAPILVFDGHCSLCNHTVGFILRREQEATLRFAPATGAAGGHLCRQSGIPDAPERTFLLVEEGRYLDRSDAALALTRYLRAPWHWLYYLRIVPKFLRDGVYNLVARNRYRLFGRQAGCIVPDERQRSRFCD